LSPPDLSQRFVGSRHEPEHFPMHAAKTIAITGSIEPRSRTGV
jgi:hypothetical protein